MKYNNIISLGGYCFVAGELRCLGLRDYAFPFDWILSNFSDVMELIENGFKDFLNMDYFKSVWVEDKQVLDVCNLKYSDLRFLHDFDNQTSIQLQYNTVREKYDRRIQRFYEKIKEPTLFIRYVNSKKDYEYIAYNQRKIKQILTSYNKDNKVIYIYI